MIVKHENPSIGPGSDPVRVKGVFDISLLEGITKNNPEQRAALTKLVATLVATSCKELSQAQACVEAGDTTQAIKLLHTLRGAVGNLGAKHFAAETINLETEIRQSAQSVREHFDSARAELDRTLSVAQTWITTRTSVDD